MHRLATRPPRPGRVATRLVTADPATLEAFLEDAAHFPDGRAIGLALPRSEGEVAAVVRAADRVLPIGAQSSLTGGGTPRGDVVLATTRLASILAIASDRVRVEAGLPLGALQEALAKTGACYPPVPTFAGATVGGITATNAAGAATFKYGSTRDWVEGLTVVLASGQVLDLERGQAQAHPEGWFELDEAGTVRRIPLPTYRMPDVPKRSAGYFAAPGMDLIDLFIGSEGTLGVITEVTLRLIPATPPTCLLFIATARDTEALGLVAALRAASLETRQRRDPRGIDVAAIESMDRRCLELLREEGHDRAQGVTLPPEARVALLIQLEVGPSERGRDLYGDIADAASPRAPDTPLVRTCRLIARAGLLEATEIVLPGDRRGADRLFGIREAVPAAVNSLVGTAKRRVDPRIEKTAADMIVPFARFDEMMRTYREGFERRHLDYAIWGHVSDGNVHPNVIPRSIDDVRAGKAAILEFGDAAIQLGGCPLAEHGVGRNDVKQALLARLYGETGIEQMRRVKRGLDPGWKLAPGVVFEGP